MRIAVFGSGAIGGYFGALLLRGGHDVTFIARGAHLEAMRRHGLTVRSSGGAITTPVAAVSDSDSAGPVDLVLFCVKSYDTEPAAHALPPLMGRRTTVLTLQNGLDNVDAIAAVVGAPTVLAGAAYIALDVVAPGVIARTGGEGKIVVGEPAGGVTERVEDIAGVLQRSGIAVEVSAEIQRVLWEKFLFITGVGGVTALARSGIGPILASPEGRSVLAASCQEIVAVAEATGAQLGAHAVKAVVAQAATLPAQWRSSMARDLQEKRRLEVDALSGAVVRRGRARGVPTPVHEVIAACLSLHQPTASAVSDPPTLARA